MESANNTTTKNNLTHRAPMGGLVIGVIFFVVLIIFISAHLDETVQILLMIGGAELSWIGLAILLELITYAFTGSIWYIVAKSAHHHLSFKYLAQLAVKQISINQLLPIGGLGGNIIIVKAMRRLGLPNTLAMEVLFVDMLAYYISFSLVTFITLMILFFHHNITPVVVSIVSIFFVIELTITLIIWGVVNHKRLRLPLWIKNKKFITQILTSIEHISSERVFSVKLLCQASLLRLGIFILDAGILLSVVKAIGFDLPFSVAFVALVVASLAGAITLMPGGLGGFEAGAIAMMVLLGTPTEIAIAGTLLLRGVTLWIPLLPGLIMAREDLEFSKTN